MLNTERGFVMRCSIITAIRDAARRRLFALTAISFIGLVGVLATSSVGHAQLPGATLRDQLKSLEQLHGVEVRGLDRVGDEPARQTVGDLRRQVMGLLRNYSYVVLQSDDADVRGVRILASQGPAADVRSGQRRSSPQAPKRDARMDAQTINATLVGFGGREYDMPLAIDTGAESVILPASMRAVLGVDDSAELQDKTIKTPDGPVEAKAGLLPAVRVGEVVAENVDVAFVPDGSVGGAVLGNSFLKQFKVSFDSDTAQLMIMEQ